MYASNAESETTENIMDLQTKFNTIEKKLCVYKYIQEGDKLGKDAECYSIFKAGHIQSVTRWWWGENRKDSLSYLDEDFSEYAKYLDELLNVRQVSSLEAYATLTESVVDFINMIIPGLYNLKKTYHDYDQMVCKIDSIIMILIDFKDQISIKNEPMVCSQRRNSF